MTPFERLRETMAATLQISEDSIEATTRADALPAWDSLGHVNLMMTLEQTFDLTLEVEDFSRLDSVPAILEYLKQQGIE